MNTIEKLDTLAEYLAQADLLELKKRELLDKVKVPAEVLRAQNDSNVQRQAADSDLWNIQETISEQARAELAEIKDPEMPPEFVTALEVVRQKRAEINARVMQDESNYRRICTEAKANIDADMQAKTVDIYADIETRKAEIAAEFVDQIDAVNNNIAKLTAEIKTETIQAGHSAKGKFYQAVYVSGRVTWKTDMLDGLIVAFPALAKARKEGEPSFALRKV